MGCFRCLADNLIRNFIKRKIMKREHIKKFTMLYKFYPIFFWYQCSICKNDFRRENGWKALDVPIRNSKYTEYHLCNSCAPTRERADEYFLSGKHLKEFRKKRPTPPPGLTQQVSSTPNN